MIYRNDHLLASINNPAVGNYAYTYDTNKNPTSETITGSMSGFGWSNTFDDNDRLINWQRADNLKTQAWDLSPVGNWNSLTSTSPLPPGEGQGEGTTATKNFTHGLAHELSSVNGAAVTHDAKGNLTQDERGLQLAWDMDNKLKATQVPANATWGTPGYHTYEYDGLGRRVAKLVNNNGNLEITMYVSDDQQVMAEYAGPNFSSLTLARKYTYGEYVDEPLAITDHRNGANNTYYYHRNRQYSVTALSDAAGQITERYTYTPHGEATIFNATGNIIPTSNIANHTTFTGRDIDQETDLYYFRARMYLPTNGNFINRDPLHYVDGASVYLGYFAPVGMDASGFCKVQVCCKPVGKLLKTAHCVIRFIMQDGSIVGCRGGPSGVGPSNSGSFEGIRDEDEPNEQRNCQPKTGSLPPLSKNNQLPPPYFPENDDPNPPCGNCGGWGSVVTACGKGDQYSSDKAESGLYDDLKHAKENEKTNCTEFKSTPEQCLKFKLCVERKMKEIEKKCYEYDPIGNNSNTTWMTAFEECAGWRFNPPGKQPGNKDFNENKRCPKK